MNFHESRRARVSYMRRCNHDTRDEDEEQRGGQASWLTVWLLLVWRLVRIATWLLGYEACLLRLHKTRLLGLHEARLLRLHEACLLDLHREAWITSRDRERWCGHVHAQVSQHLVEECSGYRARTYQSSEVSARRICSRLEVQTDFPVPCCALKRRLEMD